MKILILGGGGREHAIAWALSRSKLTETLHCAPGNPGIGEVASCHAIDPCDEKAVLKLARSLHVDTVVVGPEAPLVAGISDALKKEGYAVFGPGKKGAQLEGSKAFAKSFMKKWKIPTANFDLCRTFQEAAAAIEKRTAPYIVKADGLAAGKGAFVLASKEEALAVAHSLLVDGVLKEAGKTVIVEDFLEGRELTALAVTDGRCIRLLPTSQDHKRAFDNDQGPNTGGMGAYSPVPWVDSSLLSRIEKEILTPTLRGLSEEGIPFCGVIYAGLMILPDGSPKVLEYNVRLGDPEAQAILPVFEGDFGKVVQACCEERLSELPWLETSRSAVGVVLASGGYPGSFVKGYPIKGLEEIKKKNGILLFHAGTRRLDDGTIVTDGGRVLTLVGLGASFEEARKRVYEAIPSISFTGMHYRSDIGAHAFH